MDGLNVGTRVGECVGIWDGVVVGALVGGVLGLALGICDGCDADAFVGSFVGGTSTHSPNHWWIINWTGKFWINAWILTKLFSFKTAPLLTSHSQPVLLDKTWKCGNVEFDCV